MTDENGRHCHGTKADGSPCGAPSRLVDPETGYCPSHGPGASERMAERGRRGGYVSTSPRKTGMDLPPLDGPEAAETWAEEIARALAEDRISAKKANGMNRLLKSFMTAHETADAERAKREAMEGEVFGPRAEREDGGEDTG